MSEFLKIAFESFLRLSVMFVSLYGLYRLILLIAIQLLGRLSRDNSREAWDCVEILCRIPFGVFGFLILNIAVICVGSMVGSVILDLHRIVSPWGIFSDGVDSLIGIAGCGVIFGATIFGIYVDYPPTRAKILCVNAMTTFLVGLGAG